MSDYHISTVSFLSSDGTNTVQGWIYIPHGQPKALLQISHGMCEYIGRYHWFMERLCKEGFVVFGSDHIGHGASSPEENYGFFGEQNGYLHLVEDLHTMTQQVKEQYPQLPLFLFGHSMGSFVARLYTQRYGNELQGAIYCGSSGPNPLASMGIFAANMGIKLKGEKWRSSLLNNMAFGSYNSKYKPQRTTHDWLTRDEAVVDRYLQDPKCTFLFTAAGFRDLFTMVSCCNSQEWYSALPKQLPILLISGDMDPVGDYGKGIKTVKEQLLKQGLRDVSMILYPQARHELLNEINKEEVFADLLRWLQEHEPIDTIK